MTPKEVYLVWNEDDATDEEPGYWNCYDSLNDAIDAHEEPVEVHIAKPKLLGNYKIKHSKRAVKCP